MPVCFRLVTGSARLLALLGATLISSLGEVEQSEFKSIFDGASLSQWTGNSTYWDVEGGAITGRITKERPCTTNQYLVWKGGDLADFELKMEARLEGEGGVNGGFQFRSRLLPDHDLCGYQVDTNLRTEWLVRLYDEYGRHDLALRGERARFDQEGVRTVQRLESAHGPANFRLEEWHEYHLTCVGPKITLRVNGELVAEVEDNDPRRAEPQGVLALQLHSGPPTVAQFRNIRLKVLKPAHNDHEVYPNRNDASARRELFENALASWALDTGGHGAHPPLRLIPAFYQFELNVRPGGAGANSDSKVALLAGAYFDGGHDLQLSGEGLTVYLRLRDPAGKWNSALMGKGKGKDVHFNLFSSDSPTSGAGPNIFFAIRTDQGFVQVGFTASKIDRTAWHDLVGRYNGSKIEIFCDGQLMAGKVLHGSLTPDSNPLLIGAELDEGRAVRNFHGEVEAAAIWARALTDAEISTIGSTGH